MRNITDTGLLTPSAVALGFFDGLHLGHIAVVERALFRAGGGRGEKTALSSVVFTFNDKTALPKFREKRGSSIITFEQKAALFDEVGVDCLYAPDFGEVKDFSARAFVEDILRERLRAAYVVCGYDFRFGKGGEGDPSLLSALCREGGIECEIVPPVRVDGEIVSSTEIRRLIRLGEIERANRFLGYELSYALPVIKGNALGRTIGFPTINQKIPDEMVRPKNGVYKSWAVVGGRTYRAVTNIGVKPTVSDSGEILMETHIVGFSGDLYGETVKVALRGYLREEIKFASVEALKARLAYDRSIV
ncbi:MAG: riboflavin biosynthesis protein RibF [Bacteroides sp.]|nr:riboflavin biosynthesis protein RibF [Eubacterium sp.]MCM1419477.1 riboflavin biosynthesis protein RibF [Roseburia sp.]MCM1463301.1 riboflavin biosynthesis protein RibF [Bacteroides sp.]